jgi:hypothetical protein
MTGLGYAPAPEWRRLKNWGELARCQKVRVYWPRPAALMSKAPRSDWVATEKGCVNPLEGYKAAEPQERPELFEWREGVPVPEERKVRLADGSVLALPKALGDFEGFLV